MRTNHKHYVPEPVGDPTLFDPPPEPWEVYALPLRHGPDGKLVRNPPPPAQPVDTSLEAARKITQHTARIREAIWLYLRTQGAWGATAGELEVALGLSGSTVRPRLRELQGDAPWAKGKLPARIRRTSEKRDGMRVYKLS